MNSDSRHIITVKLFAVINATRVFLFNLLNDEYMNNLETEAEDMQYAVCSVCAMRRAAIISANIHQEFHVA